MEKQEMIDKLRAAIAEEFELEEQDIAPDAPIKETLDLDSLSLVDMVGLVEEEFGVEIKTADLPKIKTFADLYDYVFTNQK